MGVDGKRSRSHAAETALFGHLVCRPDEALDLAQGALLIAAPEYRGLDIGHYLQVLDTLAEGARPRVRTQLNPSDRALAMAGYLLHEEGFRGNVADYGDPRNSFLNEVLDRRLGIPITLSVVMLEVARRLEVPLEGVSFPGHFLLRVPVFVLGSHTVEDGEEGEEPGEHEQPFGGVYLDPFTGKALSSLDLQELLRRTTGERRRPSMTEMQPVDKRAILLRMLGNLKIIYQKDRDEERLALVEERIRLLGRPSGAPGGRDRLVH